MAAPGRNFAVRTALCRCRIPKVASAPCTERLDHCMLNASRLGNNVDVITFYVLLSDTAVLELLSASAEASLIAWEFIGYLILIVCSAASTSMNRRTSGRDERGTCFAGILAIGSLKSNEILGSGTNNSLLSPYFDGVTQCRRSPCLITA